jgi:hypothetical protein
VPVKGCVIGTDQTACKPKQVSDAFMVAACAPAAPAEHGLQTWQAPVLGLRAAASDMHALCGSWHTLSLVQGNGAQELAAVCKAPPVAEQDARWCTARLSVCHGLQPQLHNSWTHARARSAPLKRC